MASFQLPDPAGRAGGACTSAMLKILYADHQQTGTDLSYQEVLLQMRDILKSASYTQIPQLSSSRPLDIKEKFDLVPSDITGTKRAVMVGINYVGTYNCTPGSRPERNRNGFGEDKPQLESTAITKWCSHIRIPLFSSQPWRTQWLPQRCS